MLIPFSANHSVFPQFLFRTLYLLRSESVKLLENIASLSLDLKPRETDF